MKSDSFGIPTPRDELVDVQLVDGRLVITVGIDHLTSVTLLEINDRYSEYSQVKLTDANVFADAIVGELLCEEEDGRTAVHKMLENAALMASENGCDGIEIVDNVGAEVDE